MDRSITVDKVQVNAKRWATIQHILEGRRKYGRTEEETIQKRGAATFFEERLKEGAKEKLWKELQ